MKIVWIILLLVMVLCFLIYQWWFEQSRLRQMSQARRNRIKWYKRPEAWAIYSLVVFILILVLISTQIQRLAEVLLKFNQ